MRDHFILVVPRERLPILSRPNYELSCDRHMPFADHRTQAQVIEDRSRREILRSLGR